jgi:hypothetical protein
MIAIAQRLAPLAAIAGLLMTSAGPATAATFVPFVDAVSVGGHFVDHRDPSNVFIAPEQNIAVDGKAHRIAVVGTKADLFQFFITAERDGYSTEEGGVSEWIKITYQKLVGGVSALGPAYLVFDGHTADGQTLGMDRATVDTTLTPWLLATEIKGHPYPTKVIFTSEKDNWSTSFRINYFGGGVPEPQAWLLLIMGFGAVGAAARRRRSQPA